MHQSTTTLIIIVLFIFVIVGGLIAILRIVPKINKNLKQRGDTLLNELSQQGIVAIAPYFFLVPKMAPRMIGILVPTQDSIVLYSAKDKNLQKITYSEMATVEFPNDALHGFIKVTKMDGSVQEVKFGQDLDLIQSAQGAGQAVENLKQTNLRFRSILDSHSVRVI